MRKVLWVAIALLLAHCADVSTLQTARTIPKRTVRAVIGGGYFNSSAVDDAASSSGSSGKYSLKFPFLNGQVRIGLAEHLDVGGRLTLPGQLGIDGKYQFIDAGGFAAAAGLGISYLALAATNTSSSSSDSDSKFTATFFDFTIPLFLSYDINEWVAPYVSPKALFRIVSGGSSTYLGGTAGIKLGNRWGLFFEGTYMKASNSGAAHAITQVNGGIFFGSATTFPEAGDENDPAPRREAASITTEPTKPRVLKVASANPRYVLISATWAAGKRACVTRAGKDVGCGKIKKPLANGAILELDKVGPKINEGDEIR